MIKCQFCQTTHVANTIFCNECGHYLLDQVNRETDPLDASGIGWVGGTIDSPQTALSVQNFSRPPIIHLKIGHEKREIKIFLDKFVSLGRVDPEANIFPVIDLSAEGALGKSVSRRHAGISFQSGTIIIEDQASINGTFVNGNRLAPYLPETLSDGDLLQLGRLLIEVRIEPLR